MDNMWIFSLVVIFGFVSVECQFGDRPPPVLHLERNWYLQDTDAVGTVVTRIQADNDNPDRLVFGLEPIDTPELPFRIDNFTGVVYLNSSLKGKAGQTFFVYVTASDGEVPAKAEVLVKILNATSPVRSTPGGLKRLPSFSVTPGLNGNAWGQPPFINFPGFRPRPASNPIPFPINNPVLPKNNSYISLNISNINKSEPVPIPSHVNRTYVYLTAVENAGKNIENPYVRENKTFVSTTEKEITRETTTIGIVASTKINDAENNLSNVTDIPIKSIPDLTMTFIPVAIVCIIFIVCGIIGVFWRWKSCFVKNKKAKDDMQKEPSGGIILQEDPSLAIQHWRGPRAFSNRYEPWERDNQIQNGNQTSTPIKEDHWEFPRHRLKVFNILGEGAFGQVWRCEALNISGKDGVTVVAVKMLKENATEKEQSDLNSELEVMKTLEPHPNVVRLLGCCTEKEPLFVIMEYVSRGKLQSYLRNSRAERYYGNMHGQSKTLTSRDLTSFVYQVARGMEYVSSKGIVHRDLAARNVLITEDHTCKVADFGFARDVTSTHVYERKSEGRLPIRWMAPESLYDNEFSIKSDIWSFGIFMWEVVTLGSTPYPGLSAPEVMRKVRDGYRLDKPEHCRRELYNIMYYCWDKDAKERPTFAECVALLEKLLLTETDYIELERFPDHSYYNMLSLSGEKL